MSVPVGAKNNYLDRRALLAFQQVGGFVGGDVLHRLPVDFDDAVVLDHSRAVSWSVLDDIGDQE